MRQQRSGYNPRHPGFRSHGTTGSSSIIPTRTGEFIHVSGGWADAADYLQYVTTSATATYDLLDGVPRQLLARSPTSSRPMDCLERTAFHDVLDEARHGLEWLLRMYPGGDDMFNQLADDRDHTLLGPSTTDSADYGWGKGKERPVYPCTGKPQGLFDAEESSDGYASTAGKYAAAFALGAQATRPARSGVRANGSATGARGVRAGPTSSRVSARPRRAVALLLRGRQLARRHGARRSGARMRSPASSVFLGDALAYARAGTRHAVDGRRHRAPLPVVSVAQQRTLRDAGAHGDRARERAQLAAIIGEGLERVAARANERIPRRHSVHLVLEQPDGGVRDAGVLLSAHDGRQAVSRVRSRRRSTGCSARIRGGRRW